MKGKLKVPTIKNGDIDFGKENNIVNKYRSAIRPTITEGYNFEKKLNSDDFDRTHRYFNDDSIKYFVDQDNRTVTCIIMVSKFDAKYQFKMLTGITPRGGQSRYTNDNKYIGIAVCHENDDFNVEIGKDIAFERAYAKYLGNQKSVFKSIIKGLRNSLDDCEKYLDKGKKYNRSYSVESIIDRNTK